MKKTVVLLLLLLAAREASAQDVSVRAAVWLTGVSGAEEVDESVVERLETLRRHPVALNRDSRSRLLSCGLFSAYQVASLEEYRRLSGDILSEGELALVDGFGPEAVSYLAPFLSFQSSRSPGTGPDTLRWRSELLLRGTETSAGGKYRGGNGRMDSGLSFRWKPGESTSGSGFLVLTLPGCRLIAGHFHTRFGQGTDLWSGLWMNALPRAGKFARRPQGITPAWTWSSGTSCSGAAWEQDIGPVRLSSFVTRDGSGKWGGGANLAWLGRFGRLSATLHQGKSGFSASLEGAFSRKGTDLFGEVAFHPADRVFAGKAGWEKGLGEHWNASVLLQVLPSRFSGKKRGEYGLTLGTVFQDGNYVTLRGKTGPGSSVLRHQAALTLEASLHPQPGADPGGRQLRILALWQWQAGPAFSHQFRFSGKYASWTSFRSDFRWEGTWSDGLLLARLRLNAARGTSWSGLGYLEAGAQKPAWSAYLRLTLFRADAWEDRLYAYERDAPGTFSVQAYYRRGAAMAAYGGYTFRLHGFRLRCYARAAGMWRRGTPPQLQLRLQTSAEF